MWVGSVVGWDVVGWVVVVKVRGGQDNHEDNCLV